MADIDDPADFREALQTGRVGRWVKNQLWTVLFVAIGLAAFVAYLKISGK